MQTLPVNLPRFANNFNRLSFTEVHLLDAAYHIRYTSDSNHSTHHPIVICSYTTNDNVQVSWGIGQFDCHASLIVYAVGEGTSEWGTEQNSSKMVFSRRDHAADIEQMTTFGNIFHTL